MWVCSGMNVCVASPQWSVLLDIFLSFHVLIGYLCILYGKVSTTLFFVPILANPVLRIFEYKNSLESLGMDSLLHM